MTVVIVWLSLVGFFICFGIVDSFRTRHHDTFQIEKQGETYILWYNWRGTWFKDSEHTSETEAIETISRKRSRVATHLTIPPR